MKPVELRNQPTLFVGPGAIARLGEAAGGLGFRRTLLVADHGLLDAGHVSRARTILEQAGIAVFPFHDFEANPDSAMIERGRAFAAPLGVDSLVGLGGGSSMDTAKAINFVLSNGGRIQDYQGYGKASKPLLPMIGVPTTAGTGSEAQSYTLISDAGSHVKMACGDPKALFRAAILDSELAVSQPLTVRAIAGYDALSHAVETFASTARTPFSECFSREAWRLLSLNYERVLTAPQDLEALGAMQRGAYLAGAAIENSMLGAAHACANPLTARYSTTHGVAIAAVLACVVEWNGADRYDGLGPDLAARLRHFARAGGLSTRLRELGATEADLAQLADDAGTQWTGRFNPRAFDAAAALEIYRCAW